MFCFRLLHVASLSLLVVASAAATEADDGPAALLAGDYSNRAQVDALPADFSTEPARTGEWLNFQAAGFHRLADTTFDGNVIYLQWQSAGGEVSRQRLWVFRPIDAETVEMDFYSFRQPKRWVDMQTDAERRAGLQQADLVAYPEGCTLTFRRIPGGWAGALNPETCAVVTQQTRQSMTLEAWVVIADGEVWYRERGQLPDGSFAFVVPGSGLYRFQQEVSGPDGR